MSSTVAIIPARGGSKGIPRKNLLNFCGKPLLAWSIEQALGAHRIDSVWVSSDSDEILDVASQYGASVIKRPDNISDGKAHSESAWLHALDHIENLGEAVDWMVGMQATSPIREPKDLDDALNKVILTKLDSLLSVVEIEDFFTWRINAKDEFESVNYNYKERKPRQLIEKRYLENGSFYIFRPGMLREQKNRLGGKIGMYVMQRHQMFQIDNAEEIRLCESIMHSFGLDK